MFRQIIIVPADSLKLMIDQRKMQGGEFECIGSLKCNEPGQTSKLSACSMLPWWGNLLFVVIPDKFFLSCFIRSLETAVVEWRSQSGKKPRLYSTTTVYEAMLNEAKY